MGPSLLDRVKRLADSSIPASRPYLFTYWVVGAISVYILTGRLSSPNKKLRKLSLDTLSDEEASPPRTKQQGKSRLNLVKKLSFLEHVEEKDNPFMNMTWELTRYGRLKYALLGPFLLPARILLMTLLLLFGSSWANLIIIGADLSRPMPKWRLWCSYPLKFVARGLLASMGYYWISVRGSPAHTADAPIMVANHISFVDGIIMPASNLAMAVSRAENGKVPFFGVVMRALQCIFVSRTDKDSRATVAKEIETRTKHERGQWGRPLMLFPEGTTTNGTALISFKNGAFAAGVPVQPVSIKYPSRSTFDNSWVTGGPHVGELLLRILLEPYNLMEIHYLPPYVPSAEEVADPSLYARNVREVIARDLGVHTTDHCFDDVLLLIEARKLGYRGSLRQCVVETKALRKVLEVDLEKAKDYLQTFARLDTGRKGMLTYDDFRRFFAKEDTPELQNLFALLDTEDQGAIRFRQFLCGMAILNEQGTSGFEGAMNLAFKTFDSSGEGRLSKDDVRRVLGRCMVLSEEELHKIFEEADLDKDDRIDVNEFLEFARKHKDLWPHVRASIF